ncbi:NADH dehydrogenase subunit 5 [Cohnella thermotolerans]|uniref:NADH dehydrogenase subunit 5 n=1 Tax=Cohnella thermotolerans TaxID=329858 RepID=UPI000411E982|nr:NADH dehydrogenase subunit 5 [Cohnella thermotolerans]
MLTLLNSNSLTITFFVTLSLSLFSALFMLHPRVPLKFVRFHVGIYGLSPLMSLLNLVTLKTNKIYGPWHLDPLAWLTALFVLTIGFVIQRYSIRYLLGDRNYRKYFALFTFTTGSASVAWLSDDLRWLMVFWGFTLLGITWLISLNKKWQAAKTAIARSGQWLTLSWLMMLLAIIWLAQATGHWQLSFVLAKDSLTNLGSWEKTGINLLMVFAVAIPAAQYPFQRWLLDSVVAPTPVSAVMHAGIVNAGGILLTRFAPLFSGDLAQIFLIVLSGFSVLLGTGMILVQVDYKRQLVGSTIAQMGFMLIQCALGAYLAAIIHAVLHGLFKSTLFLQAGSVVHHYKRTNPTTRHSPLIWNTAGGLLGLAVGFCYWINDNGTGHDFISALLLGWSVSIAWTQLVTSGHGHIGRIVGFSLIAGVTIVFNIIHAAFKDLLHGTVSEVVLPSATLLILVLFILLSGNAVVFWSTRHHSSTSFAALYLWLVRLSEPHPNSVESHPKFLVLSMSKGGNKK